MDNLKLGFLISLNLTLSLLILGGFSIVLGFGSIILLPFLSFFIEFKLYKILKNKNAKKYLLKGIWINLISSFFTYFSIFLMVYLIQITRHTLFNENISFDFIEFINHILESVVLIFFIQSFIWFIVCLIKYKRNQTVE
jgi:hypothetical protein